MGLFNKKEKADAAAKSTSSTPPSPTEDSQPKIRQPYVPRHAARDGMIGAPTGWNAEEQNVVRLENRRRDLECQASGMSVSRSTGHGDIRAPPSPGFPSPAHMSRQLSEMSLDSKLAAASSENFSRSSSYLSVNSEASSSRLSGGDWSENNNKLKVQRGYFSHSMDRTQLARSPLSTPATSVGEFDTHSLQSVQSGALKTTNILLVNIDLSRTTVLRS